MDDEELLLKRLLGEDEEAFEELVAGHDGALARQSGEEGTASGSCARRIACSPRSAGRLTPSASRASWRSRLTTSRGKSRVLRGLFRPV